MSSTIVAIPFIVWDILFTFFGVWHFDLKYTLGIELQGLPLEEWLFFFCIPFACVFTYFCLDKFFNWDWAKGFNNLIAFITIIVCVVVAFSYSDRIYTLVTAIVTVATVVFLHFIAKKAWLGQASFIFGILMLGFIPVNGILTGTGIPSPIVNYNPEAFMGIRFLTIPLEDAVYGYCQFLWNIYFFKWISSELKPLND